MTHHIRQHHLYLELSGTEPDGQLMQQLIPDLLYEKLFPALEKVFDQSVPAGKLLKIDRLDIDAGSIPIDHMDKELTGVIIREMARVLKEMSSIQTTEQNPDGHVVMQNSDENTSGIFLYFLETGKLPWHFSLTDKKPLNEVVIEAVRDIMKGSNNHLFINKIKQTLSDKSALLRLGNQFPETFLTELLNLIAPSVSELSGKILSSGEMNQFSVAARDAFTKSILAAAFSYFSYAESPSGDGFRSHLLRTFPEIQGVTPTLKKLLNSGAKQENRKSGQDILNFLKPIPEILPDTEPVYIRNAGLILLHPFLPGFFESLHVSQDAELLNPEKAMQLLGYLVSGHHKTPEYELVLPKILCGIPVNKPLMTDNPVDEQESAEGITLLKAVIGHWEALRDTSPDGLRGSFLYRPGKLSRSEEDGWVLQVESRSWDILLDQLPWGIAMIKLPWMREMLRVEWNY